MKSKKGRNFGAFLSLLTVFAFLVSSLGNIRGVVYAQDIAGETPTPEVIPTLTETPTEEPTMVPTQEPTLEPTLTLTPEPTLEVIGSPESHTSGIANLSLVAPEGWGAPIVISTQPGTHTTGTLTDGEVEFIDLAVFNSGDAVNTPFNICLKINAEEQQCWEVSSLASNEYFTVEDWQYTANRGAGSQYFELTVDGDSAIAETDETDNTWAFDFTWMPSELSAQSVGSPLIDDALQMPDFPGMHEQSSTGSSAPGYWDNASFMVDSIAVGVILPESTGAGENWTSEEQTQVSNEIVEGLNRWANWSTTSGEFANKDAANANVSFSYDFHFSVPTTYEPIQGSAEYINNCTWLSQVMTNMGYANSMGCSYQLYDYLNDLRASRGTKWATLIFVVDSSTNTDGTFSNGYFGYAYLHGPYIMMTYDNDGWGIDRMDQVIQHEMGHMFGAGDNYYQAGYGGCESTTDKYGYLGIANSNCEYNNPSAITDVLMNSNTIDRNHWTAQYQVGWRDLDQDSFPDVVDTLPSFTLDAMTPPLHVTGAVYDRPQAKAASFWLNEVTINTITAANYKVDEGSWYPINAADGVFDEDYEPVSFNISTPTDGSHTLYIQATNSRGNTYTTSMPFSYPLEPPANDRIPYAIPMSLDTTYTNFTIGATINSSADGAALADPINVCNSGDTGSVWYQFTAPSTGVFTLNTYGSDFNPNLTVVKKVSDTSRSPVVCGELWNEPYEDYYKLSFNGTSGATYLIGVSDAAGGGSLSLKIQKEVCPSGYLCGAVVGGDGKGIHWPYMRIIYSNGWTSSSGEFSGFIMGRPYSQGAGTYKVVTAGDGSLIVNPSVAVPGLYAPSAVGYPKTLVTVKDTSGNEIDTDNITVVSTTNRYIGYFMDGSYVGAPLELYAPAGTYNFFASSDSEKLEVYQPGINIVSSSNPGSVALDASALPHDTFTFDLDGITDSTVWISSPDNYAPYQNLTADGVITFAAPAGTEIPWIDYSFYATDSSNMKWNYNTDFGWNFGVEISGGADHAYTVGGALTFSPSILNDPIRLDEGMGEIYSGIRDGHGNGIYSIYYYGDSTSTGLPEERVIETLADNSRPGIFKLDKGGNDTLSQSDPGDISAQEWILEYTYPTYTITDADEGTTTIPGEQYCLDCIAQFEIPSTAPTGTWSYEGSMDLGPYGGGVKIASGTFEVYSLADHPLTNDDFNNATLMSPMPYSVEGLDTSGGTQASDDPLITALGSKGYASTWFKFVPIYDATLTLDTFGSNYDTVLNVWQGSRGALANKAYNDDFSGMQSKIVLQVNAGQTYYIEVTQYVSQYGENLDVQSLGEYPTGKDGIEIQSIGGLLNLHASVVNCYSLTAKPNNATFGSVTVSPAPNCRTTKYTEGTAITLGAISKTNYGFTGWSDSTSAEPYTFNIGGNTTLTGNFVYLSAPTVSSPSQGALIPGASPFITWTSTPYAAEYEFQIATNSTFTSIYLTNSLDTTTIVPTLNDGIYYLRVRTVNARGEYGPWSVVRSFTIDTLAPNTPVLSTPLEGATPLGIPTFYWLSSPTAVRYQFMYSTSTNPAEPFVYQSGELTTTSHKPLTMQGMTPYFWFVRARDAAGNWSDWSSPRGITVIPLKPLAVVLDAPVSGYQTNDPTPELKWKSTIYAVAYELQVDDSYLFNELIQSHTGVDAITGLSHELDTLMEGVVYYWRVRAVNANGEAGPWSAYRTFKTDYTAPLIPVLSTPLNAARPVGTPTFYWKASLTAVRYQFQYSLTSNPDDPTIYQTGELTTTSHKPPTMTMMTEYYWFVRARDAAGNWSPWSAPFTVTSVPPRPLAVILDSPASGYLTNNQTPELKWKNTLHALVYELQVDDSYLFTEPLVQSHTMADGITGLSHVLDTLADGKYYWRIRAMNENNDFGQWSASRNFTIDTTAPLPPVLSNPLDGARPVGTPTFYWKGSLTATRYQFMYGISAVDSNPYEYLSGELSTTYHKPPTMTLMTKYYWFVRAKDVAGNWSPWSVPFEVMAVPPAPPAVTLDSPITGYLTNNKTPELKWKNTLYADKYELQVDDTYTFDEPLVQGYYEMSGLSKVLTELADGNYYWRVRAENVNSTYGPWSASRTFTIDTTAPLPLEINNPPYGAHPVGTPTFYWMPSATAVRYQFQYGLTNDPSDPYVYRSGELTTTSHKPPTMTMMTEYYWFVRARDAAGNWSHWSPPYAITVVPPAPPAVALDTPNSGYLTNNNTPQLNWQAVLYAVDYELQVDDSYTFSLPLVQSHTGIAGLSKVLETSLADGNYYWRVRAKNANNVFGAWSASRTFTIDTTAPAVPVLVSLPDSAGTPLAKPALSIGAVSGAARYRFQIATQDTFAYPIRDTTQTGTVYTTPVPLMYGNYYWRVKAIDAAGNESVWSSARLFTVTLLKTPANNALLDDSTPTFTWNAVTGALEYQMQVSTLSDFSSLMIDRSQASIAGFTPTDEMANGTYYWRVRYRTTAGWSAWQPVWKFSMNSSVLNGSFESGSAYWSEYSQKGWALITVTDYLPIAPRGGIYAAWLGGDNDEYAELSQSNVDMGSGRYLHFWYWIASSEYCGYYYDQAWVVVNGNGIKSYDLCSGANTGGWRHQVIDLQSYTGSTINLSFVVDTDFSVYSSFYLDNVSITNSSTTGTLNSLYLTGTPDLDAGLAAKKAP